MDDQNTTTDDVENFDVTEQNDDKPRRERRTPAQIIADLEAEIAARKAALDGKIDTSTEHGLGKALRNARRKRNTALKAAQVIVEGIPASDGKGWTRKPMSETIKNTEKRLESQRETLNRAEYQRADLPTWIARLDSLLEALERGDDVEFPREMPPLENEKDRSDEEHEAAFYAKSQEDDNA